MPSTSTDSWIGFTINSNPFSYTNSTRYIDRSNGFSSGFGNIIHTPMDQEVQEAIDRDKDIQLCPLFHWRELCKSDFDRWFEQIFKEDIPQTTPPNF